MCADLCYKMVGFQHHIPSEGEPHDDSASKKYVTKNENWYPIYTDKPNSYQEHLMFEPCTNCNYYQYALAQAVNYYQKYKAMSNKDWKKKAEKIKLTDKDAPLVLQFFKKIDKFMVGKDES